MDLSTENRPPKPIDPIAWEPAPSQYAFTAWIAGWISALVIENFLLGDTDLNEALVTFAKYVVQADWGAALAGFLLPWVLVPLLAFYLPIRIHRPLGRPVLFLGAVLLAALLILLDVKV